jgi:hypothetical protein
VVRGDLLGHEATDRLAVVDVVGFEQSSPHRIQSTRPISGHTQAPRRIVFPLGLAHRREFSGDAQPLLGR